MPSMMCSCQGAVRDTCTSREALSCADGERMRAGIREGVGGIPEVGSLSDVQAKKQAKAWDLAYTGGQRKGRHQRKA